MIGKGEVRQMIKYSHVIKQKYFVLTDYGTSRIKNPNNTEMKPMRRLRAHC